MLLKQLLKLTEEADQVKSAWLSLLAAADDLGDDETKTLSKQFANDTKAFKFIKALQAKGVNFDAKTAMHWVINSVGSFEITHPKYKAPEFSNTTEGSKLQAYIEKIVETLSESSDWGDYNALDKTLHGDVDTHIDRGYYLLDADGSAVDGPFKTRTEAKNTWDKEYAKDMPLSIKFGAVSKNGVVESLQPRNKILDAVEDAIRSGLRLANANSTITPEQVKTVYDAYQEGDWNAISSVIKQDKILAPYEDKIVDRLRGIGRRENVKMYPNGDGTWYVEGILQGEDYGTVYGRNLSKAEAEGLVLRIKLGTKPIAQEAVSDDQSREAWKKIINELDDESGTKLYSSKHMRDSKPLSYIAKLISQGINFDTDTAAHWMNYSVGSFVTTHQRFKPPVGYDTPAGKQLSKYIMKIVRANDVTFE